MTTNQNKPTCMFACALAALALAQPQTSEAAGWGQYLTYDLSRTTNSIAPAGASTWSSGHDCPQGYFLDQADSRFPGGGWFEAHLFQNMSAGLWRYGYDPTRRCPRSFTEVNHRHAHGIHSGAIDTYGDLVFAVTTSNAGYFTGDPVSLQQDPSKLDSLVGPSAFDLYPDSSYMVGQFWRNSHNMVDTNPWSATYVGQDCDNNTGGIVEWGGNVTTGADQYGTKCHAPALIQTFDPDIKILESENLTMLVWTERVVGTMRIDGSTKKYSYATGSHTSPIVVDDPIKPADFPYTEKLIVRAELIDESLVNKTGSTSDPAIGSEPIEEVGTNPNLSRWHQNTSYDAMAPRVAGGTDSDGNSTFFVAWAEGTGSTEAPSALRSVGRFKITPETLYVALPDPDGPDILGGSIAKPCNEYQTNAGRVSGRRQTTTGTHDIAVLGQGTASVRPVIVHTALVSGTCKLRVSEWTGSSWALMGGVDNLAVHGSSGEVRSPRMVVHGGYTYITWAERESGHSNWEVFVKRFNGSSWVLFGDGPYTGTNSDWAYGHNGGILPTIAVADPADGANIDWLANPGADGTIYVAFQTNFPGGGEPTAPGATERPNFMKVKSCKMTAFNGCFVKDASQKVNPTDPFYNNTASMGPGATLFDTEPFPNTHFGTLFKKDPGDYGYGTDGMTDIVVANTDASGEPNMYLAWSGGIRDHRTMDMAMYARKYSPEAPDNGDFVPGYNAMAWPLDGGQFDWPIRYYWTLGQSNYGMMGTGNSSTYTSQTLIYLPEDAYELAYGEQNACIADAQGRARCIGRGVYGVTNDTTQDFDTWSQSADLYPELIDRTVPNFVQIDIGGRHACARTDTGHVQCWGRGGWGQIGNGSYSNQPGSPTLVTDAVGNNLSGVIDVRAGRYFTCALLDSGQVACWGKNIYGTIGQGNIGGYYNTAQIVKDGSGSTLTGVAQLEVGRYHSCVRKQDGEVLCWGYNGSGQLALGHTNNTALATSTAFYADAITLGGYNTTAIKDGEVWSGGEGSYGRNGVSSSTDQTVLTKIPTLSNIARVWCIGVGCQAAKRDYTYNSNDVDYTNYTWGLNSTGGLPTGDLNHAYVPEAAVIVPFWQTGQTPPM